MDYRPNYYSNRNAVDKSNRYKKKRIFWLNSSFNSDFVLIDNKIYEISWDIPPFEIYKNNRLKLLTYIRDSNQSKPIQIKLKLPLTQSRDIINTDKEAFPIIYTNHSAVEAMTYGSNPIIRLIPQQISRFSFRLDDNFNQLDYNYYFSSITNGSVFQVAGGNPDDKYIIFNSSGSFVLDKNLNCDIFMIGGGGGGGAGFGGGGGAGAYYRGIKTFQSGTYTITIGAGGQGQQNIGTDNGVNGGNTTITLGGITILNVNGGAKGAGYVNSIVGLNGKNGGCGSGAAAYYSGQPTNIAVPGGLADNTGTDGTGFNGGTGYSSEATANLQGGGGGGIGGNGGNAIARGSGNIITDGAKGGDGLAIDITGTLNVYGGGGAGGVWGEQGNIRIGIGGGVILNGTFIKVGGDGGLRSDGDNNGKNAVANTGSGGGGASGGLSKGGNGSAGIVIIRFKEIRNEGITAEENLIQATNNTITVNTDSKYVINYQNPVNIPKGTYETIFANGAITFKSKPDYNYPTTSKSPIVWYKFDGSQLLYDSSGNNNNLINNDATLDNNNYKRGNGSLSVSNNKYVSFINDIQFRNIQTTNGISISVWFKGTTLGSWSAIFSFGVPYSDGNTKVFTAAKSASTTNLQFFYPRAGNSFATSGTNYFNNTWYHLIWTITNVGVSTIYINGVNIGATIGQENFADSVDYNTNKFLGRGAASTSEYLDGNIDDFRIFDYVLSPVEVYDLYNGNTDRSYPILKDANNATINPFVWYKFDTTGLLLDSGTSINNLTNNASTLDITNFIKGNGSLSVGNGKYVSITNDIPFRTIQTTNGITISLWFRGTSSSGTYAAIFHSGLSYVNDNTNVFKIIKDGSLTNLQFYYPRAGNNFTTSGTNYFTGAWHHIVWTISNTGVSTIYINGVNVNSSLPTANFNSGTNDYNSNKNLGRGSVSSEFLDGNIDDFRMYDITLTATQVSELYNGRISIYNPPAFLTGFELEDEDLIKENTISSYK